MLDHHKKRLEELQQKGITDARSVESKNYKIGTLNQSRWFVHCSTIKPNVIASSGGLRPDKSSELCVSPSGVLWGKNQGRLVLSVACDNPNEPIVAGFIKNQGYLGRPTANVYTDGYLYVFRVDSGRKFYSPAEAINQGAEVAFDFKIATPFIKVFHNYNKGTKTAVLLHDWTS